MCILFPAKGLRLPYNFPKYFCSQGMVSVVL